MGRWRRRRRRWRSSPNFRLHSPRCWRSLRSRTSCFCKAQAAVDAATQDEVDEVVTAVGWAIVDPEHNRALSELAVGDTGLGNVKDKMAKNRRKTMGLLRDLAGVKSVGVIAAEPEKGLV